MFEQYKTVKLSGGQLQVANSGAFLSSPFFYIALVGAIFLVYRSFKVRRVTPLLVLPLWCIPWIIAILTSDRSPSVLLDRTKQTATIRQPTIFWYKTDVMALDQVTKAEFRIMGRSGWMVLTLANHDELYFPPDLPGEEDAVQAINDYLGASRR